MEPQIKQANSTDSKSHLGITFGDVHSDEPHESISAKKTESKRTDSAPRSHLSSSGDVFDVTRAFENEHIETGTIVSDRRRQRPTLMQELGSAFNEWWGGTKKSVTHALEAVPEVIKTEPKPVIEKAEARAEVVKEAVSHAVQIPHDDHRVVIEKVRTFAHDVEKVTGTPITLKAPATTQAVWTHTETPGEKAVAQSAPSRPVENPDLRTSMVAPVVEARLKHTLPNIPPPQIVPTATVSKMIPSNVPNTVPQKQTSFPTNTIFAAPVQHAVSRNADVVVVPQRENAPVSQPVITKVIPQRAPEPVKPLFTATPIANPISIPTPRKQMIVVAPSSFHSSDAVAPSPEVSSPVPKLTPNSSVSAPVSSDATRTMLRYGILVGVAVLGITLAVVASIYFNVFTKSEEPIRETITAPTFFATPIQTPIMLTGAREAFLNELHTATINTSESILHVYPTITEGKQVRPATTEETLQFIGAHLDAKTLRGFDDIMMFGSVMTDKSEPFIILRSHSFDTLFAGLLAWEQYLISDFAPFLGTQATDTHVFTDTILHNAPARILSDAMGNEILLYTFVNQNTVIITTSKEAVSELTEKLSAE